MLMNYDIQWIYETGYDEVPVCRAFELYIDEDGDFNSATEDVVDRYRFTESDMDWVIQKESYDTIDDLWIDDWNTSEGWLENEGVPPGMRAWIESLPEYEVYDKRLDK